jgi:hypothetical protein
MSDTIFAMRRFVFVGMLAACADDPQLHVTVTHPTDVDVASTTVTDYESPTLSCDDVEFARLGAAELDAVAVASVTIDATPNTGGALSGISRSDPKVIVARGFDTSGGLVSAGCAEQGVIEGQTNLAIMTAEAATASVGLPQAGAADQTQVIVNATDPGGKLIDGRAVSWTVYGPAGSAPALAQNATTIGDGVWQATAPICTASGSARVHPVPPGIVGGYAMQMRVAWATELPPMFTGLVTGGLSTTAFTPPTGSRRYCAARVSGATRRLDCLDGSGANVIAREFQVMVSAGQVTLVPMQTQALLPDTIAIVSVPSGTDLDVYAITQHGHVLAVFPRPGQPVDDTDPVCPVATCPTPVDDALVVPACDTAPARLMLHVNTVAPDQQIQEMPATGGTRDVFPVMLGLAETTVQLDSGGCVTELKGAPRQVTSLQQGTKVAGTFVPLSTLLYYDCTTGSCSTTPMLTGAGIGFTTGSEPRLVASSVDATGVVLVQLVFAGGAGQRQLVQRTRIPALSAPDKIVVGQFDGDGQVDLVWDVTNRHGTSTTLEIAYARLVGSQPLEAISSLEPFVIDDILSVDLAGDNGSPDGLDDLVLTATLPSGAHGIAVIASGVHAPAISLPVDTTCAP